MSLLFTNYFESFFTVNAGLCMWGPHMMLERPPSSIAHRSDAMTDSEIDCCETYLWRISTNPLSLKQICRINIRNRLIAKMKDFEFINEFILPAAPAIQTQPVSILHSLIVRLTDLPRMLHHYLYEFPDIPSVPNDIDVFINY